MLSSELSRLLPSAVHRAIAQIDGITELRLRLDKKLGVQIGCVDKLLPYIVSKEDIDAIVAVASNRSMYACQESLARGYLPCEGGLRLGVCGEAVRDNGRVVGIKNIQSLVIRVPHEVRGCADKLSYILNDFDNTLIVSPPSAGKTTLLREMVRIMANRGKNILLLDERGEVSSSVEGKAFLDVGECCDIVAYTPKVYAYEGAVRSMNPHIIATDEIFGISEVEAILDVVRSGVKVLATVHGDSIDGVLESLPYSKLIGVIKHCILLSKSPTVGSIAQVRKL